MSSETDVLDRIRRDAARVATRARHVAIDADRLAAYATELATIEQPSTDPGRVRLPDDETTVAFVVTLDAINFGSGWFPHLNKPTGLSGYHTVASAWRELWQSRPPSLETLASIDAAWCAVLFDQLDSDEEAGELMALFAEALNQLARYVLDRFDGRVTALVEAAEHRAARLVTLLDECSFYSDIATHDGEPVAFYKRAQITAFDLYRAFDGRRFGRFEDLERVTMFADNLVPHVLRLDGVLSFDPQIVGRIERGNLLEPGSVEEVEIRACAVHAVELLVAELVAKGFETNSGTVDGILWERGGGRRYKASPRHRTRCVFY